MSTDLFAPLKAQLRGIRPRQDIGVVTGLSRDSVVVAGLDRSAALGDRVRVGNTLAGEILRMDSSGCTVMPEGPPEGVQLGMPVSHIGPASISPHPSWLGRVIDPDGRAMHSLKGS